MSADPPLIYCLNDRDELSYVSDGWARFALENGAPDLLPPHVLGRPLWDFLTDPTTADLYRRFVQRARAGAVFEFRLRCDAPARRRLIALRLEPWAGGGVQFTSRTAWAAPRPSVDLLTAAGGPVRVCSWCQRVEVGAAEWAEAEEAVDRLRLFERTPVPLLTHGICADCLAQALAVLDGRVDPAADFTRPGRPE